MIYNQHDEEKKQNEIRCLQDAIRLILDKDNKIRNDDWQRTDEQIVSKRSPGICPICSCENVLLIYDDLKSKSRRSFCHMCGFIRDEYYQIDESGAVILPSQKIIESIGAGVIGFSSKDNTNAFVKQVPRNSTQDDVKKQIAEMLEDPSIESIHATWFDETTKKIVHLM